MVLTCKSGVVGCGSVPPGSVAVGDVPGVAVLRRELMDMHVAAGMRGAGYCLSASGAPSARRPPAPVRAQLQLPVALLDRREDVRHREGCCVLVFGRETDGEVRPVEFREEIPFARVVLAGRLEEAGAC